jgi:hypothetical protein
MVSLPSITIYPGVAGSRARSSHLAHQLRYRRRAISRMEKNSTLSRQNHVEFGFESNRMWRAIALNV